MQLCKHPVTRIILEELEAPLLTGSLPDLPEGYDTNYLTDPELIEEYYGHMVDLIIDGGVAPGGHGAIIDCTGETTQLLREGTIESYIVTTVYVSFAPAALHTLSCLSAPNTRCCGVCQSLFSRGRSLRHDSPQGRALYACDGEYECYVASCAHHFR